MASLLDRDNEVVLYASDVDAHLWQQTGLHVFFILNTLQRVSFRVVHRRCITHR